MNKLSKILIVILIIIFLLFLYITFFKVFKYNKKESMVVVENKKNELLESLNTKYNLNIKYDNNEDCTKIEDCNITNMEINNYDNEDSVNLIMTEYNKDFDISKLCPVDSLKCRLNVTATGLSYGINLHYLYNFNSKKLLLTKINTDTNELIINQTTDENHIKIDDITTYENKYLAIIEDIGGTPVSTKILYIFDSTLNILYTYNGINIKFNDTGYEYDSYLTGLGDVYNQTLETYNPNLVVGYRYKKDYVSPVTFSKKIKLNSIIASESAYK